ncbi:MAG: tyrosine-type recombinase/integrase, partial [Candidatus Cybelea sp.]
LEGHKSPYVFTTYEGTFVGASTLRQRYFKPLLETAKLPDIPFHGLRHTFATTMLGQGVAVKIAAEALGHANPAITARLYQHVTGDLQGIAIAAVDKVLSRGAGRSSPR